MSKRRNPTLELLRQTNRFVDDLEEALALKVDLRGGFDGVLLCGMGGSAISGDIVADLCSDVSPVPVGVLRYPALPRWVSERALVVVASYSGNTRETKRMYEEAAGAGCTVAVICSGGDIEKVARERGDLLIKVPSGIQPRQSTGFMIGYISRIIDAAAGTDLSGGPSRISGSTAASSDATGATTRPAGSRR